MNLDMKYCIMLAWLTLLNANLDFGKHLIESTTQHCLKVARQVCNIFQGLCKNWFGQDNRNQVKNTLITSVSSVQIKIIV